MDTTTIQEAYNIWSWLSPLISGAVGALIGTYGGSYFIQWKQEQKIKDIRSIAIKALNIFKAYAKKSYSDTANEFNNSLNISEKRAIVVALHKIGVPFEVPTNDILDIKNLKLKNTIIDADEVKGMIQQIENGNCDNFFFNDIESYFTSNLRINAVRSVGKKYVEEVQAKSHLIKIDNQNRIENPQDWYKSFSPGELQTIFIFRDQLANPEYFSSSGFADPAKIKVLIREIEIGLWDNYLFGDYDVYQNTLAQRNLANMIIEQQKVIGTKEQPVPNNNKIKPQ